MNSPASGPPDAAADSLPRPWWIPPFFGGVPAGVAPGTLALLGALALALFFEDYDLAMLTAALHLIAADLGMAETDLGLYLGVIRLGALPALLAIPFADRLGRRRVFLLSLVCTSVFTFTTAFARTPFEFVALQMLTRTFFVTGAAVAVVIVVEEFPAAHRGWGLGMLAALGACGHGFGMLLYSQVGHLPAGWRALYALGIAPLLLLGFFRRRVHETQRYRSHAANRPAPTRFGPFLAMGRQQPRRALAVAASGFLPAVGMICAYVFSGYFTQTVHGWSPGQYSAMVILGGAVGIVGNVAAGRLGDRWGRRRVGFALLGSFPLWVVGFYGGPGWLLPFAFVGIVFSASGGRVVLRALATEVFPTGQRATASGLFAVLETLGAATGLLLTELWNRSPGDFVSLTGLLSLSVLAGAGAIALFPETRQRELEEISRDPGVA